MEVNRNHVYVGHMFGDVSRDIVREADVVLISGTYVFPEVFPSLQNVFAHGAQVFHIDLNAYEIAKNFPVDLGIVADPKSSLADLADAIVTTQTDAQRTAAATRLESRAAAKRAAHDRQRAADVASWGSVPLRPSEFMAALAR